MVALPLPYSGLLLLCVSTDLEVCMALSFVAAQFPSLPHHAARTGVINEKSRAMHHTAEPRWRCGSVMGHSDTTLSPKFMTTMASNMRYDRNTIIHCCPMKNKALRAASESIWVLKENTVHPGEMKSHWERLGTVMYLHYYRWQFYTFKQKKYTYH